MNRQMLPISAVVTLLLAAVITSALGWLGGGSAAQETGRVEGGPVLCPDGRPVTTVFELNGSQFHVVGALVAIEGRAAVIAGPTGDVPIILGDGAEVSAGLVVGEPVDANGMLDEFGLYVAESLTAVCPAGASPTEGPTGTPTVTPLGPTDEPGPTDGLPTPTETPTPEPQARMEACNRGPGHAGDLRLEVKDGEVKIKRGTVLAYADGSLTVDTPGGPLTVLIVPDTEVKGDLSLAAEVRIEGMLNGDGAVVAEKARALCPDEAHHARDDDDDDDDADDDDDDDDDVDKSPSPTDAATPAGATPDDDGQRGADDDGDDGRGDDDDDDDEDSNRGHGGGDDDDDDDDDRGHDDDDDNRGHGGDSDD